ncbi:Lysine-specific permease [Candidatus Providencia siddallii]|uniref:Lysine-specific permease n=1 Tax=Candidatus Providencia siddallii TaxID=1715285 RepID=A0A0M6WA85_9GAMM|nr:Lysine-specific permease [Candidatus Providencia siddallii]
MQKKYTNTQSQNNINLRRELKARHISMIAIGGSIGTGLFVASGTTLAHAGPGGALLAYAVIGLMVYFLMTSLGELATHMPVSGSFATYGAKYIDEGFGFALGWNYWYNWAITIAADLVSSQLIMNYWFPNTPSWIWSIIFLAIIFFLNLSSVKYFGETEYWFSLIKVTTIIIFIIIGLLIIFNIIDSTEKTGWYNWNIGEAPFVGGFSSMISIAMIISFSFQGTELIGITAGESKNPSKSIPNAIHKVFWRILLFYMFTIFIISLIIPYTNTNLLCNNLTNISVSPFTLVFKNAGLLYSSSIMNAIILIAVISAGNSGMYASTRILYTLAVENKAPRIFSNLSKKGTPINALIATTIISALCFLSTTFKDQAVYIWLLNTSGVTGFIAWIGIAVSHYRFRKGYILHGNNIKNLTYRSNFFPIGPIFSFILCLIITVGQNYQFFLENKINLLNLTINYIGIPIFLIIWFGYKIIKKSSFIDYKDMKFNL